MTAPTAPVTPHSLSVELARHAIGLSIGGCVRTDTAEVACWAGDMGIGYDGSLTPTKIAGLKDIAGVAMFTTVACAWDTKGAAWCWTKYDPTPAALTITNVVEIVGGHQVVCARHREGSVSCWDGEKPLETTTTFVIPIKDAVELASDDDGQVCARHATGAVSCWHGTDVTSLERMPGVTHATSIAATDLWWTDNSTALVAALQDKQLVGWVPEHHRSWQMPVIPDDTTRIVMGSGDACAVGARVKCWEVQKPVPAFVPDLDHVLTVELGLPQCAIRGDGKVVCWGPYGELGDGTSQVEMKPQLVANLNDAVQLAAGGMTCARRVNGHVSCWGASLVDGHPSFAPVDAGVTDAIDLVVGETLACVRRPNHETACWGRPDDNTVWPQPRAVPAFANADRLVVLGDTPCAIRGGHTHCLAEPETGGHKLRRDPQALWIGTDGGCARYASGVECWRDPSEDRHIVVDGRAEKLDDVVDIAFDSLHTIAWVLRRDGTVRAQSRRDPLTTDTRAIARMGNIDPTICALHSRGNVTCHNSGTGPLGLGAVVRARDPDTTITMPDITDGAELVSTGRVMCVRRTNHQVMCWGDRNGLGNGESAHRAVPGLVPVRL